VVTSSTTVGNKQFSVVVTCPQFHCRFDPQAPARVDLYITPANPSAGAGHFFCGTATFSLGTVSQTINVSTETDQSQLQLYADSGTVGDDRPPAGDRGVAVTDRVWVADQANVYASKQLRPNIAAAWNTSFLAVRIPSSVGSVQALCAQDDKLVVLCSAGAVVVYGPGFDDQGNGPGFSLQVFPGQGCTNSCRSVTQTEFGTIYLGTDGDAHAFGRDGQFHPLSRPVRTSAWPVGDVFEIPSGLYIDGVLPSTNRQLVLGSSSTSSNGPQIRVMDMEGGQWGTWTLPASFPFSNFYFATAQGVLWAQCYSGSGVTSSSQIVQFNGNTSTDLGTAFNCSLKTSVLRPGEGPQTGWGWLRSVFVTGTPLVASTSISCVITADANGFVICNKTLSNWGSGTAPSQQPSDAPEFTTTWPRCEFVQVQLTWQLAELFSIDVWAAPTSDRAPARNRV
jgi:hypothetical protein